MSDNNSKSLKRQRLVPYSSSASSSDDRKTNSSSSSHNVIIKATDMKEDMQTEAVNIATAAFEKDSREKDVAQQIKEAFDKDHGPTLHCIVGRNFETSNKMSDNNSKSLKRLMPSSPSASSSDDRETNSSSSSCNVIIKATDMKEDMQTEAVRIAKAAFENDSKESDVAQQIKQAFDKNHGPTWHCIVGRDFGSYVTHETNHFVYFSLHSRAVLLFKYG